MPLLEHEVQLTTTGGFELLKAAGRLGEDCGPLLRLSHFPDACPLGLEHPGLPFSVHLDDDETPATVLLHPDGTYTVHAVVRSTDSWSGRKD